MDATHDSLLTQHDPRLVRAIVISAAAHVLVLGTAVVWSTIHAAPRIDQTQPIIAHLVRLGKPRDPKLLPRKWRAPPPPKPAAVLPVKTKDHAMPKPRIKPRTSKRSVDPLAAAVNKIADEYKDKVKPEEAPGAADGSKEGDAVTASEGDRYLALVQHEIHSNYKVPSIISDRERVYLNATVVIYVAPDGHILRRVVEKASGNQQFDDALLRAIDASNPLPPPPAGWRERFQTEGLGVKFKL